MPERPFVPPWERRRALPGARPLISPVTGKTETGRTPYQLGRAFEGAIKGRLERRGYFVMRAYASKGRVDLLAIGPSCLARDTTALFVQCKRRGQIGTAEWNLLYDLAATYGAWPVVTMKLSEKTVGFYRLDDRREPRSPKKPWTMIDPANLAELLPPPTLL